MTAAEPWVLKWTQIIVFEFCLCKEKLSVKKTKISQAMLRLIATRVNYIALCFHITYLGSLVCWCSAWKLRTKIVKKWRHQFWTIFRHPSPVVTFFITLDTAMLSQNPWPSLLQTVTSFMDDPKLIFADLGLKRPFEFYLFTYLFYPLFRIKNSSILCVTTSFGVLRTLWHCSQIPACFNVPNYECQLRK